MYYYYSPRRTGLPPAGAADAHAHDPRVANLAEGRREAAGHFAELVAAGGGNLVHPRRRRPARPCREHVILPT